MIGFYYGNTIPGSDAKEGVYFINIDDNEYSIYIKRKDEAAIKYGEINSVTPEILDNYFTNKMDKENPSGNGTLSFNGNADFTGSIDAAGGFKVNGQDITELITTIAVFG